MKMKENEAQQRLRTVTVSMGPFQKQYRKNPSVQELFGKTLAKFQINL